MIATSSLLVIALGALTLPGCSKGGVSDAGPQPSPVIEGSTSAAPREGDSATAPGTADPGEVAIPEGFPDDFPLITAPKPVIFALENAVDPSRRINNFTITYEVGGDDVYERYVAALHSEGWETSMEYDHSPAPIVEMTKGNQRAFLIQMEDKSTGKVVTGIELAVSLSE